MKKTLYQFWNGLVAQNPVLVLLLGLCPVLAVSVSLRDGVAMGLSAMAVLMCSNLTVSLLRRQIPSKIRIPAYLVIIAGYVTLVELLMGAFAPGIADSLGLYLPLMAVNCIMLSRAENFASKNGAVRAAIDGLAVGLGFALVLCAVSAVREFLGNGTLFSNGEPVGSTAFSGLAIIPPDVFPPVLFFAMPMGGFLTLACAIAAHRKLFKRKPGKEV